MNYFKIKFGLDSGKQNEIVQLCKTNGFAVIQTGEGLCVATKEGEPALKQTLGDAAKGAAIESVSASAPDLPPDVRAFISENL